MRYVRKLLAYVISIRWNSPCHRCSLHFRPLKAWLGLSTLLSIKHGSLKVH